MKCICALPFLGNGMGMIIIISLIIFLPERPPAPSRVQLVRATTNTLEVCWGAIPTGMLCDFCYSSDSIISNGALKNQLPSL